MDHENTNLVVCRVDRNKDYKTINLTCISDKRLSWKSKGIHNYLVTRPDNWEVIKNDLIDRSVDGPTSFYSGINELIKLGYVFRMIKRDEQKRYVKGGYYTVEIPINIDEAIEKIESFGWEIDQRNPDTGNPDTGNPDLGNHPLTNKYNTILKNVTNNCSKEQLEDPPDPPLVTGKSSRRKIYRDPFLSFTDTAKELFYYWNELSSPIPHHKFKTKSFTKGLEALDKLLNKGYSKKEIRKSMSNYQWLLSMDSSKLKSVYGTVVGLPEFCQFSEFSIKQIERYNKIIIGIDSWFIECLEPKEVLEAKWSKLIKDERPEETKELKRLWKEAGGRRLQGSDDENIFRRISIKAYNYFVELNGKYQWGMVEKYPITRLHYLFDALQAEGQDFSMFKPEWLLSPKMFSDRLPMHWKRIALAKPLTETEVRELYESPEAKERQKFNSHLYVGESSREATMAMIAAQKNKPGQENMEVDYD